MRLLIEVYYDGMFQMDFKVEIGDALELSESIDKITNRIAFIKRTDKEYNPELVKITVSVIVGGFDVSADGLRARELEMYNCDIFINGRVKLHMVAISNNESLARALITSKVINSMDIKINKAVDQIALRPFQRETI